MSLPDPYAHTLCAALAPPRETRAARAVRLDRVPERCLDALFIAAQSERGRAGFAYDLQWCAGLCRATWREEALWNGLVHVQCGANKRTHLMHAAQRGDFARVRWLLARGAPTELADKYGWTACMWASECGHVDIRVLLAVGAKVNAADADCMTALHLASAYSHVEVIRVLLAAGADINAIWTRTVWTPLHWAAHNGHVDIIRALLAAGADATRLDSNGHTARQWLTARHPTLAWPAP